MRLIQEIMSSTGSLSPFPALALASLSSQFTSVKSTLTPLTTSKQGRYMVCFIKILRIASLTCNLGRIERHSLRELSVKEVQM